MNHPAPLTATEREMIAEAEAAGRVTRCPPCAFSTPAGETMNWREQIRVEQTNGKKRHLLRRQGEIAQRRADVQRLHRAGMSVREIAAKLGRACDTIKNDLKALEQ